MSNSFTNQVLAQIELFTKTEDVPGRRLRAAQAPRREGRPAAPRRPRRPAHQADRGAGRLPRRARRGPFKSDHYRQLRGLGAGSLGSFGAGAPDGGSPGSGVAQRRMVGATHRSPERARAGPGRRRRRRPRRDARHRAAERGLRSRPSSPTATRRWRRSSRPGPTWCCWT